MWLHAIALDEVRDMIGASDAEAARLRAVAADRFGRHPDGSTGLLGKLGPVLRRPIDAPVLRPDTPLAEDCDRLLAGQHVPPPRLAASWRLLQAWIEATAWSSHSAPVDRAALNTLDFDLARAGVAARFGVSALVEHHLDIALLPPPELAAGHRSAGYALQAAAAWRAAAPELEPAAAAWISPAAEWLGRFGDWTQAAAAAGRRTPDLIAILTA